MLFAEVNRSVTLAPRRFWVSIVTNARSVQGITSLQQVDPAFVQFRLLLTNRLPYGKVLFIILERGEKRSARNQLQGAKQLNTNNRLVTTLPFDLT